MREHRRNWKESRGEGNDINEVFIWNFLALTLLEGAMQVSKGKKQAMNLKEKGEGFMGQFVGRKGGSEM